MKYRVLIPPVLVVLFVISIFSTMKNNTATEKQYEDYINQARDSAGYEIYVDAEADYNAALGMKKSVDIYKELLDVYIADNKDSEARRTAEKIVDEFPYDGRAYAISAGVYKYYEKYPEIYSLYKKYKKQNLYDEDMEKIFEDVAWLCKIGNQFYDVGTYSNGLCAASYSEDLWGYVDTNGESEIEDKYKYAGPFIGDIAPVETVNGIWYFIDMEGNKKKVLNKIENVKQIGYVGDAIPVFNGETWAYYTNSQKLICDGYDEAMTMANGYAAVKKGELWQLIDGDGKAVTDLIYTDIVVDDKGISYRDCYFAQKDGKYHMYDIDGNVIGSDAYDDAKIFNPGEDLAAVSIDGKWGFIDATGKRIIEPQYDDARSFSNGVAAVKSGNKWGFINESGEMVIKPTFSDAKDFNDSGKVKVKDSGTWQLLKRLIYED